MGPDGMVEITQRKVLDQLEEPKERDAEARSQHGRGVPQEHRPVHRRRPRGQVDDVIDPADTRFAIWQGLQVSRTKHVERPWRKHGVLPV